MKLRLPKKRRYRIALYLLSSTLILLALDLLWVRLWRRIDIGYDTTRLTGPLRPDGTVDYLRALDERMSAGVTPENNATPLLFAAVGPRLMSPKSADYVPDYVYARLGMNPVPEIGDYYKNFEEFLGPDYEPGMHGPKLEAADKEEDLCRAAPWTAPEHPHIAEWLSTQSHPLQLFQEASLRPRYYFPGNPPGHDALIFIRLPRLGSFVELANMAASRAMLHAGSGDVAGAQTDLLTIHRMARLLGQSWTIIGHLVAVNLDNRACRAEQHLAASERLTGTQARQMLLDIQSLPALPAWADSLDMERNCSLDMLVYASRHGMSTALNITSVFETNLGWYWIPPTLTDLVPAHFNAAMRQVNSYYDASMAAANAPTYAQRRALFPKESDYIGPVSHDPTWRAFLHPTDRLLHTLLPDLDHASALCDVNHMESDLTRVALALAAYHADHAAYPDILSALAPAYLPAIPPDLFIDAPLHYTRTPTGYLLYSVGMNAKDDGGHTRENRDPNPPAFPDADDLAVRAGAAE